MCAKRFAGVDLNSGLNIQENTDILPEQDKYCLATIKHYRSLVPMAQERRKPIFNLTSADGAIGAHASAVQNAKDDFEELAKKIANEMNISFQNELKEPE